MEYFRLLLLLSFAILVSATSVSADQIIITAVIGENWILPCRAENRPILVVEWRRTDIEEGNVLRYRGQVDPGDQHPSFKDRVVFQDREMKDGDVSLVLIDVTMNDAGTYEAEVVYHGTKREKKLTCSIHLDVAPTPPPPPPDQINIKAVIGENKTLPCRAENRPILVVEWKRTDIKEDNVLRYRGQVDPEDQHPSFKDRVIFQDIEMKNGDVSLVLINVTMNDSGTYEAEVIYDGTNREKKLICSIHLDVAPPTPPPPSSSPAPPSPPSPSPPPDQFLSWAIALLVTPAVLVLILSGFLFYRCRHIRRWRLSKLEVKKEKDEKVANLSYKVGELLKRQDDPNIYKVPQVEESVPLQDIASAQTVERINEANGTVNEGGEQNQTNRNGTTMNERPPRTEDTNGHSRGGAS